MQESGSKTVNRDRGKIRSSVLLLVGGNCAVYRCISSLSLAAGDADGLAQLSVRKALRYYDSQELSGCVSAPLPGSPLGLEGCDAQSAI